MRKTIIAWILIFFVSVTGQSVSFADDGMQEPVDTTGTVEVTEPVDQIVNDTGEAEPSDAPDTSGEPAINEGTGIELLAPLQGAKVDIRNSIIQKWLGSYTTRSVRKYRNGKNRYYPRAVTLKWDAYGSFQGPFKVRVSEHSDMSKSKVYFTSDQTYPLYNLKVKTNYYWSISASSEEETISSEVGYFKTDIGPRTIYISNVGNTRDIGGWPTADGKVLRQGLVYRSANLDSIDQDGIIMLKRDLGVRTDLDLRQKGSGLAGEGTPLGDDIKYIQFGTRGGVFNENANSKFCRKRMAKQIRVFANKANYPIVVHCKIGRDRTGLVCYVLEALCGVSANNLIKEYQLSFLSDAGGSNIKRLHGDLAQVKMVERMLRTYGKKGDSLQTCTENYLRTCGLRRSEINAIKKILVKP